MFMLKKAFFFILRGAIILGLFRAGLSFAQQEEAQPITGRVDFTRDIRPIFEQFCYKCHAGAKPAAQLRLDSKPSALKGGISGRAITPSNGGGSLLVARLVGAGDAPRMPLGSAPLSARQVALVRAWIDQGAEWPDEARPSESKVEKHWAYVRPARHEPPAVKDRSWPRNPIDNFLLARLEREGLRPSPEASKETLIRRLTLDLTGLPPGPKEVDDFLRDRSATAYEKLVDRLLASPHYGERWARVWLDLARYADTNGYEKDRRRSMWKYRDWVINALNKDMPFDQFTVEQIAGDLLPQASEDQMIATGFHRNAMFNEEGGVDQEEAHWETILDRVNTTATVWLGTTLACAQCHNHKYDPFTQKDYYRLFAFFNNTDYHFEGNAKISEQKLIEPRLEYPTAEQVSKLNQMKAEMAELERLVKSSTAEREAARRRWEAQVVAAERDWTPLDVDEFSSTGGATLVKAQDKSLLATGASAARDAYLLKAATGLKNITALRLEALPEASLPGGGPGRDPDGNFLLTAFEVEAAPADAPDRFERVRFKDAFADDAVPGSDYAIGNLIRKSDGLGWAVDASKDAARVSRQAVFVLENAVGFDRGTVLKIRLKQDSDSGSRSIGRFRISVTSAESPALVASVTAEARPLLAIAAADRTREQAEILVDSYNNSNLILKAALSRVEELRRRIERMDILRALVMKERPLDEPPSTHVRVRGSFLNKGEKVYADVPAVLPALPEGERRTRLALARWLVDGNNPLVARVTVNRFWEQFFGHGIVETSEDFGTQGERPTHPELLDWLATEFARAGWSMKSIHRLIVTSSAYRQSSRVTPQLLERDPYNRLIARGPRFRLEAEMVRDTALAVGGLLSRKVGGPSVFPPQPDGIWNIPYNDDRWTTSAGEDRYRRGLYTFWRRTSPYPSLAVFDAPSREFCTVRRVRTNTPLQALTTLNDPAFFEAARGLAQRMMKEGGGSVRERAAYGFRLATARRPAADELERLVALYEQEMSHSKKDRGARLAAWTIVANVLLNLDETLTKE